MIEGLGFGLFPTLLLQSASYVVQLLWMLFCTGATTYLRNTRTYFMLSSFALAIAGVAMIRQVPAQDKWTRFAGYSLIMAFSGNFPMVMSMASGNFGGFTKKVTVNALVSIYKPPLGES